MLKMSEEEVILIVRGHLVATWMHALKGPDKKSKLGPAEQFGGFINKTAESIINAIKGQRKIENE
jgi:hypothetical protein